jgi:hypothetical protein
MTTERNFLVGNSVSGKPTVSPESDISGDSPRTDRPDQGGAHPNGSETESREGSTFEQGDEIGADVLAVRMLPVLMHRMNNATQLLSNLHAVGQYVDGNDWLRTHATDLSECSCDIHESGYLLAVIASANGADLLLERREARGVHSMVSAVIDAVSRDGGHMRAPCRPLPDQAPDVLNGWELPWAFGTLLYASTLGQPAEGDKGATFDWQLLEEEDAWVLVSSTVPKDHFAAQHARIETLLPETQLDVCIEGWSWRLPAAWLRA